DSLRIIGNVNIVDNGILSIITPSATSCAMGGELAKVEVRLYNNGNVDGTDSLLLTAVIDSAGVAFATLSEKVAPLLAGENNRNYTFKQQYRVPRLSVKGAQAPYKVTVFLAAAAGDIDLENDTAKVEACVQGGVGVNEALAERWTVGQNVPNPASGLTRIPYVVPEAGLLTLRVMGMNGQLLYREEVNAEAGAGDIRVNLSDLAAGVYYYSVEYRGERIVRKMNVTR
ncbi:MAG: T9SS type A sorting domain-containing protein, partial [Bacteroidales bacterium]|nr:T9SS type A sorting domain-containing protein [Bacteroidales bacterium]